MTPRLGRYVLTLFAAMLVSWIPVSDEPPKRGETALDRYIAKLDNSFSWTVSATYPGDEYTTFVVDLKSQTWRTAPDVDRTQWQHWLVVVRPKEVRRDTGFLFITGGRNGSELPKSADAFLGPQASHRRDQDYGLGEQFPPQYVERRA